jgi:hypothetical protein
LEFGESIRSIAGIAGLQASRLGVFDQRGDRTPIPVWILEGGESYDASAGEAAVAAIIALYRVLLIETFEIFNGVSFGGFHLFLPFGVYRTSALYLSTLHVRASLAPRKGYATAHMEVE